MQETQVRSLGWEDPLEKEMATHSSNLAWKIPWMEEESGGLQSMWSQSLTRLSDFTFTFIDCSPQGSSVHGVFQARIVEWVAISSSRASSPTRDGTRVSAGKGLTRATEQYPERPRDGGNTPGIARSRPATLATSARFVHEHPPPAGHQRRHRAFLSRRAPRALVSHFPTICPNIRVSSTAFTVRCHVLKITLRSLCSIVKQLNQMV